MRYDHSVPKTRRETESDTTPEVAQLAAMLAAIRENPLSAHGFGEGLDFLGVFMEMESGTKL